LGNKRSPSERQAA